MVPRIAALTLTASCCNGAESFAKKSVFTQIPSMAFQTSASAKSRTAPVTTPSCHPLNSYRSNANKLSFTERTRHHLQMSSVPDEDDYSSFPDVPRLLKSVKDMLPPFPEDHFALSGDVVALFVYSYLDHTVHDLCVEAARMDISDLTTLDPAASPSLPVWFDVTHLNEFGHWLVHSSSETASYAPAIASGGLAFVAMATCWIVSGYFNGAFMMKNTIECDAKNAILVTGKTWVFMALLMVGLALGSDALWGQLDVIHPLSAPARGGLTKADADYIFDSLSVLAFWRWMFNYLLGYR